MRSAWAIRKTLRAPSLGKIEASSRTRRAASTLISPSSSTSITSGWLRCSALRQALHAPQGSPFFGCSHWSAAAITRPSASVRSSGPISRTVCGNRTASAPVMLRRSAAGSPSASKPVIASRTVPRRAQTRSRRRHPPGAASWDSSPARPRYRSAQSVCACGSASG